MKMVHFKLSFGDVYEFKISRNISGINPMRDVLEKYGGWPVVEGDKWSFKDWNWLKTSIKIVNDGLIDLILACHIEVNPKNSSEHILIVS